MNKKINQGAILKKLIKEKGYTITWLAKKLHMSRNTLYRQFESAELPLYFIGAVGSVTGYKRLPLILEGKISIENEELAYQIKVNQKYIELLERNINLLEIIAKEFLTEIKDEKMWKKVLELIDAPSLKDLNKSFTHEDNFLQ